MKIKKNTHRDRTLGILFGTAYGDAMGRPTEFLKTPELNKLGSPFRHAVGINNAKQGIVTDDTQMSIAIGKAAALDHSTTEDLTDAFIGELIGWYDDPASTDGKRAPGMTCMSAVKALKEYPAMWQLATRPDSKGNGANMRVAPLALRTDWSWEQLAAAAQLQAAITHGHPTALASAELTAVAVRMLLEGIAHPTERLLDHLIAYAQDQRTRYRRAVLGDVWAESGKYKNAQEYIKKGWDETVDAVLSVYDRPRSKRQDPCSVAGGAWIAEEALAASLHTLLCFPGDPANALRRAVFSDGDSDSIGAITGALAGAAYGVSAFPQHWRQHIEYRAELTQLEKDLFVASN